MTLNKSMVESKFLEIYPNFKNFLDKENKEFFELRSLCFKAACDEKILSNIKFCNDKFAIPPVRSFCANYKKEIQRIVGNEKLTPKQKRGIGAFWGAVFKGCLNYKYSSNKPVPLKDELGVSTASYFYPDPDDKEDKSE